MVNSTESNADALDIRETPMSRGTLVLSGVLMRSMPFYAAYFHWL